MHLITQLLTILVILFGVALVAALDALSDAKLLNQELTDQKLKLEEELFERRIQESNPEVPPQPPGWWVKRKKRRR